VSSEIGEFRTLDMVPEGISLEDLVTTVDGEEKQMFLDFAKKMLCWLPQDRKSAKELLNDPWLYKMIPVTQK
jgi:hypothetical protein